MKYKCLLIDMDGLLVDSERITFMMWQSIFERHGYTLTLDLYCKMLGQNEDTIEKLMGELFPGLSLLRDVKPEWDGEYANLAPAGGVPLKPGALELLEYAESNGIAKAVVSSNLKYWIDLILNGDKVYHRFDLVVDGSMAEHGKPAPDLFLLAADRLGFRPEECLVLEDSNAGITAAHNAGMDVICVPDLRPPSDICMTYVTAICDTLSDVIDYL